jgi:S1-C subfamily serine protease
MLASALALALVALPQQLPDENLIAKYGQRLTVEARVYQQVEPSVVRVELEARATLLARVLGRQFDAGGFVRMSSGTGVIYSAQGLVVTNAHVITPSNPEKIPVDARRIRITFSSDLGGELGRTEYTARVLAIDARWDLALLQIEHQGQRFKPISFGISSDLLIGEKVIALGAAFGESLSLSTGVISGLARTVTMELQKDLYKSFPGLIQTDAAINQGNSGGPLLNIYGDMIGLTVAVLNGAHGISYAIPVDQLNDSLAHGLLDGGFSTRYWSGMAVSERERDLAPMVTMVHPRGPAGQAGLQPGDRILSINSIPVISFEQYSNMAQKHLAGETLDLAIRRGGKFHEVVFQLLNVEARNTQGLIGLDLVPTTIEVPGERGNQRDECLLVAKVYPDSPAAKLGLQEQDLILAIGVKESPHSPDGWSRIRSIGEMVSLMRGPSFELDSENIWILRNSSSFKGQLLIDDPDVLRSRTSEE